MSSSSCISYLLPSPHSNIHKFHNKTQSRFLFSFPISKINNVRSLKTRCGSDDASSFHGVGDWWSLPKHREDHAEPTEAKLALRRMLELVAHERWVAVVAFGSLVIAALSEITMPSILAASIFSAQSGETAAFSRNAMFLVLLCFTSGICSGLRSGCFGILNVTLVKRLRENLYTTILFQDISYFDKEKVGTLTSRLAADCQQLSHVIGNDLQLILRNSLQGTGAIINLLVLSWPLALSALMICFVLSAIFLVYGRYQRKAAKLTQDFSACANDVAQETLSLIRTVRVYGTRKEEFERYNQWLQKLAFISGRDSLGNGLWNLSFNTLYRSTQLNSRREVDGNEFENEAFVEDGSGREPGDEVVAENRLENEAVVENRARNDKFGKIKIILLNSYSSKS
ncbi:unnamed protein product [Vicia faba]|uniref:ABC transmembrane type-1 domain-containing protein n=1 Tax=Vicia faba TaxID=3906 RepID=A0AAV1A4N6_VICFA|nr:unnamed protein product [Vicia faba]